MPTTQEHAEVFLDAADPLIDAIQTAAEAAERAETFAGLQLQAAEMAEAARGLLAVAEEYTAIISEELARPHTWADGFGVWHATVTGVLAQDEAARIARDAIVAELAEREGAGFAPGRIGVKLAETSEVTAAEGISFTYDEVLLPDPVTRAPRTSATRPGMTPGAGGATSEHLTRSPRTP